LRTASASSRRRCRSCAASSAWSSGCPATTSSGCGATAARAQTRSRSGRASRSCAPACALHLHWLCTACALPVHCLCALPPAHGLCTASHALHVHCLFIIRALPPCAQLRPAGRRHLAAAGAAAWRPCGARVPSALHAPRELRHRARHLEPEATQGACVHFTTCQCMHACLVCFPSHTLAPLHILLPPCPPFHAPSSGARGDERLPRVPLPATARARERDPRRAL